jgi:N-acetylneuraminate lyase
MLPPLSGLVAAPFTPFRANGDVALETIPQVAALLARNGVKGAFVCGTTGEGSSLTSDERREVAAAWRKAAPAELKLTVHVGHLSLRESQALARHAQQIGADAVATLAPNFFKPANVQELVAWCANVAAAAPNLPFYYYHMPSMTGVNIPVREFLAVAPARIPNFVGVKFTHEDLADYADSYALAQKRYSLLFGRDEILLSGLQIGADGAVGSTYNYAAPLYHQLLAALAAGDLETARARQAQAREFIDVMNGLGGLPAGKAIMKFIGVDCGPVRSPLSRIDEAREAELHRQLTAIGFFTYASRP